jgi:hypothetical protein
MRGGVILAFRMGIRRDIGALAEDRKKELPRVDRKRLWVRGKHVKLAEHG